MQIYPLPDLVMIAESVALLIIALPWGGETKTAKKKPVVEKWLQQLDRNDDGRISREEVKAGQLIPGPAAITSALLSSSTRFTACIA